MLCGGFEKWFYEIGYKMLCGGFEEYSVVLGLMNGLV
jgi:hypothetical protein